MDIKLFAEIEPLITNGMSTFQIENFVVNESITPYKKLRQAMIEARGRLEVLANGEFDLMENQLKKQKAEMEAVHLSGIDLQLKEIEIKRLDYIINRTTGLRRQQQAEAEYFMSFVEALVKDMGGVDAVKEALQDPAYLYQQESEYWTKKLARSVFADFVNYGTISKGLTESIACLPKEQQKDIFLLAIDQQSTLTGIIDQARDTLLVEKD
jgi:hypothetical protein